MVLSEPNLKKSVNGIHPRLNNITIVDILTLAELAMTIDGFAVSSVNIMRLKERISHDMYEKTIPYEIKVSNFNQAILDYAKRIIYPNSPQHFLAFKSEFDKSYKRYLQALTHKSGGAQFINSLRERANNSRSFEKTISANS